MTGCIVLSRMNGNVDGLYDELRSLGGTAVPDMIIDVPVFKFNQMRHPSYPRS
jgi:hypothetical protein